MLNMRIIRYLKIQISGAAIFAGHPYIYGNIELALNFSKRGLIDEVKYLDRNNSRAYIFQGLLDPIVPWCKFKFILHIDFVNCRDIPSDKFSAIIRLIIL